jgi:seryl-tRNA synthetase
VSLFDDDNIDAVDGTSNDEALQTDVMRFLAIIAFSLLVIFIPIVQSLPREATEAVPVLIEENRNLKRRLARIGAEIGGQLRVIDSLNEALRQKNKKIQELLDMEKTLKNRQSKSNRLQAALSQKKIEAQQLKAKMKVMERNNVAGRKRLRAIQKKLETSRIFSQAPERIRKKTGIKSRKGPPRVDIVFASQQTLLEFVESGKVRIFLFTGDYGFQLQYRRGNMTYRRLDRISGSRYTMPNSRIPEAIRRVSRQYLGNILRDDHRYELKLSPSIQKNLSDSLNRHLSGKFVITRTGRIEHEPLP